MNTSCSKKATLFVYKRQPAAVPNIQQIVSVVVGGPLQDEIFQSLLSSTFSPCGNHNSSPHVIT